MPFRCVGQILYRSSDAPASGEKFGKYLGSAEEDSDVLPNNSTTAQRG